MFKKPQNLCHAIIKLEKYNELLKVENIYIDVSTFLYKIVLKCLKLWYDYDQYTKI